MSIPTGPSREPDEQVRLEATPGPSNGDRGRRWSGVRGGRLVDVARATTPYAALAAMVVYFSIASPYFLTVGNLQDIARQGAVLLVVALGATFVILMGSIDLSVASIVTLSGIATALLAQEHINEVVVLLLVVCIGATAGLINGVLFAYVRLPSFLVTLGTSYAYNGAALLPIAGVPVVLNAPHIAGVVNSDVGGVPTIALIAVGCLVTGIVVAKFTPFGRAIYAIGGAERVAALAGMPVARYKALAFVLSGACAAIAGLLLSARLDSGSPGMGDPFLLSSIAAVVISGTPLTGGIGGPQRTVLGVLILGVVLDGMTLLSIDPFTQNIVEGVVVIAAVAAAIQRRREGLVK